MKHSDEDLPKKAGSAYVLSVANLGLGLIIFIVFVLSLIYGDSSIRTIITLAFAAAYIGLGIWGMAKHRSKK